MDDGINKCEIILRRIAYLGERQALFCVFFFNFLFWNKKKIVPKYRIIFELLQSHMLL